MKYGEHIFGFFWRLVTEWLGYKITKDFCPKFDLDNSLKLMHQECLTEAAVQILDGFNENEGDDHDILMLMMKIQVDLCEDRLVFKCSIAM